MIRCGGPGRQGKQLTANIQNNLTHWLLKLIHLRKKSATFFRCFKNCPARGFTWYKWVAYIGGKRKPKTSGLFIFLFYLYFIILSIELYDLEEVT